MPYLPLHKCAVMSCGQLTSEKYCEKHKHEIRIAKDKRRGNAQERGYTARWQKVSKMYLKEHPICECEECTKIGRLTTSNVVHHIIPHHGNYELFWDEDNWQAMNKKCHDRHTLMEIRKNAKSKRV